MFIKLINGVPKNYTIKQLLRDNPLTSFPESITEEILSTYDVYSVTQTQSPFIDSKTHRQTYSVELIDNNWTQVWQVVQLDSTQAETNVRAHRNRLLQQTDWMALSDNTLTTEWANYRYALRNISSQPGFPYSVEWPNKPNS